MDKIDLPYKIGFYTDAFDSHAFGILKRRYRIYRMYCLVKEAGVGIGRFVVGDGVNAWITMLESAERQRI